MLINVNKYKFFNIGGYSPYSLNIIERHYNHIFTPKFTIS